MIIDYLGHSSFLIHTDIEILIDPYCDCLGYGKIREKCDIVLITHDHRDHNNISAANGRCSVLRGASSEWNIEDTKIKGFLSYHDDCSGEKLGNNTIFTVEDGETRICHLGDLGHSLSKKSAEEIGPVDILMAPIGGNYTIGPQEALATASLLKAKILIPMHYRTAMLKEFTEIKNGVGALDNTEAKAEKIRRFRLDTNQPDLKSGFKVLIPDYK